MKTETHVHNSSVKQCQSREKIRVRVLVLDSYPVKNLGTVNFAQMEDNTFNFKVKVFNSATGLLKIVKGNSLPNQSPHD